MKPPASGRRSGALLLSILALAAVLRLYGLADVYPVVDEYHQLLLGLQANGIGDLLPLLRENPHHVLLDPLLSFLAGRLGDSLWIFRLPRLILGLLAVAGLWRLGREEGERRAALAAFLLSISLLHIDWSRRVDFYALLTALSVWQAYTFREALKTGSWTAYAILTTLFLYAHPYAALTLPLHGLWLAARQRAGLRRFALCWAANLALFAPWFFFSSAAMLDKKFLAFEWFPGRYTLGEFLALIPLFLGQAPEAGPHRAWELSSPSLISIIYVLFYCASFVRTLRGKTDELTRFCHYALILGAFMVVGLDLWYGYFLAHRQLLWLLPFYLLAVSEAALAWRKEIPLALAAGALFLPGYWEATKVQVKVGRGLEELAQEVRQRARPDDVFGFEDEEVLMGFLYHYDRKSFPEAADLRLSQGRVKFDLTAGDGKRQMILPPWDAPAENLWTFRGKLDDLTIIPPRRRRP
jgi:hypothetical protein